MFGDFLCHITNVVFPAINDEMTCRHGTNAAPVFDCKTTPRLQMFDKTMSFEGFSACNDEYFHRTSNLLIMLAHA